MTTEGDRYRWLVVGLALFAFVRVGLCAASFPFFGHLDEVAHVDTVFKYARGQWPEKGQDRFDDETVELFVLQNSPLFLQPIEGDDTRLLVDRLTPEQREIHLASQLEQFRGFPNHESLETAPYYVCASAWLHVARALGLEGLHALYFVRTLGGLVLACAVIAGYLFVRRLLPDRPFLWFGVPMLLAVYPQDALYFINNDVPLVALFPICAWLALRLRDGESSVPAHVMTGAALAIALIAKATDITICLACFVTLLPVLRSRRSFLLLAVSFLVPMVAWHGYYLVATGHLTPSTHKTDLLGVTVNTWAGIAAHPMWSPSGLAGYFADLHANFWRGEIRWLGEPMRHGIVDWLLLGSTLLFACASLGACLRRRRDALPNHAFFGIWVAVAVGFAMMVGFSVGWEFGENTYPSRDFPFLTSGRLQSGMFALVALLYLDGLERLTRRFGPKAPWIALALVLATLLISESILMSPVVANPHNLWHLDV